MTFSSAMSTPPAAPQSTSCRGMDDESLPRRARLSEMSDPLLERARATLDDTAPVTDRATTDSAQAAGEPGGDRSAAPRAGDALRDQHDSSTRLRPRCLA